MVVVVRAFIVAFVPFLYDVAEGTIEETTVGAAAAEEKTEDLTTGATEAEGAIEEPTEGTTDELETRDWAEAKAAKAVRARVVNCIVRVYVSDV